MRILLILVCLLGSSIPSFSATADDGAILEVIDMRRPDEASPFFLDQQLARQMTTPEGQAALQARTVARYPTTHSPDSMDTQLSKFFGEMFANVRLGGARESRMATISVSPATFSLADRREIDVTYRISNMTRRMMVLDFSSSQRFDVVVKDSTGKVVERWSDDRSFSDQAGVVTINPREFIEYTARIPTREMQAGQNYLIQASLEGHPEYTQSIAVTPR